MIIKIISEFERALSNTSSAKTYLIETDDFQFQNHLYNSLPEFIELYHKVAVDDIPWFHVSGTHFETNWIPNGMEENLKTWIKDHSEYPILSILITSKKVYALLGCSVFVMNDQGKTIDRLNSHEFFTPDPPSSENTEQDVQDEERIEILVEGISSIMDKIITEEERPSYSRLFEDEEETRELFIKDAKAFLDDITNEHTIDETAALESTSRTPIIPVDTTEVSWGFRG